MRERERERERERDRETETDRQTDRQTEKDNSSDRNGKSSLKDESCFCKPMTISTMLILPIYYTAISNYI